MRVVSFYTNDVYQAHAERMAATASAVGLKAALYRRPDGGSWGANLRHKSEVLLDAWRHTTEDILFVDADCRFVQYPSLLKPDGDWDIAWKWMGLNHPHACVIHVRRTPLAYEYMKLWDSMPEKHPMIRLDEVHMQYAYREMKGKGLRLLSLPPSYGYEKKMRRTFGGAEPVIYHLAAGAGSNRSEVLGEARLIRPCDNRPV